MPPALAQQARRLEELTLASWPALQTVAYDGWLVRWAEGYSARANSVNPLYGSTEPLPAKIACCLAHYQHLGLPAMFKITPAADPELEGVLTAGGYERRTETVVETIDLTAAAVASDACVALEPAVSPSWVTTWAAASSASAAAQGTVARMLALVPPVAAFGVLRHEDEPVATGFAVLLRGHVGLFSIMVHPTRRGRGFGRRLCSSLLAWGRQHGAQTGHLAVEAGNLPALRLYDQLGFEERYRYWYRVSPA